MSETMNNGGEFIGYEYKEVTVSRDKELVYADAYENFGWKLESSAGLPIIGLSTVTMKFRRDRKIRNKAELTRLQRQFDAYIAEIESMERSKASSASIVAYTIGLIGTAFVGGATFAYLGGLIPLCIVLAVPGFVGWVLPYFMYNRTYAKKAAKITPLVESLYDEIYGICEKANGLLGSGAIGA